MKRLVINSVLTMIAVAAFSIGASAQKNDPPKNPPPKPSPPVVNPGPKNPPSGGTKPKPGFAVNFEVADKRETFA